MRNFLLLFFMFTSGSLFAQVGTADAAYANMQRAVGGIVQSVAATRGASVSDPRTYATLYGMGRAASASVAVGVVGTGLLVATGAATAPAWGTILAVAAISGAVSYGVSLGIDKLQKWIFGTNDVSTGVASWEASFQCTSAAADNPTDCVDTGIPGRSCAVVSKLSSTQWIIQCFSNQGAYGSPQLLASAANAVPAGTLASPVDYSAMALIVNDLWKKAAAQPDYQGLPYSVTQPVTETEVQAWALANPASYPTVEALLSPIASPSVGLAPSSTSGTGSAVSPVVTPVSPTPAVPTPAPAASTPVIDLGPNPVISSPVLDSPDWLKPLVDMLPGWRTASFSVQGECLRPTLDLNPFISKVIVMSTHCDVLESQRAMLSVIMSLVWVMVAAFIVLKA